MDTNRRMMMRRATHRAAGIGAIIVIALVASCRGVDSDSASRVGNVTQSSVAGTDPTASGSGPSGSGPSGSGPNDTGASPPPPDASGSPVTSEADATATTAPTASTPAPATTANQPPPTAPPPTTGTTASPPPVAASACVELIPQDQLGEFVDEPGQPDNFSGGAVASRCTWHSTTDVTNVFEIELQDGAASGRTGIDANFLDAPISDLGQQAGSFVVPDVETAQTRLQVYFNVGGVNGRPVLLEMTWSGGSPSVDPLVALARNIVATLS